MATVPNLVWSSSRRATANGAADARAVVGGPSPGAALRASVLVIDDDPETRGRLVGSLSRVDIDVSLAASGAEALMLAEGRRFDLILSEMYLPDMTGINVVNRLRSRGGDPSFIFLSAYLTITTAVEAMQIGALSVVEKPVESETLVATVLAALGRADTAPAPPSAAPPGSDRPRSVADRWARHVWKACESLSDFKTLADWARFVGISYSSLCETCRLVHIRPSDARDFMRVLRAVVQSARQDCRPEVLLDVSDRRTLRNILVRTGLNRAAGHVSVAEFLDHQTFIPANNEGLLALRALLESPASEPYSMLR